MVEAILQNVAALDRNTSALSKPGVGMPGTPLSPSSSVIPAGMSNNGGAQALPGSTPASSESPANIIAPLINSIMPHQTNPVDQVTMSMKKRSVQTGYA